MYPKLMLSGPMAGVEAARLTAGVDQMSHVVLTLGIDPHSGY